MTKQIKNGPSQTSIEHVIRMDLKQCDALLDALPEGLFISNSAGEIIYINQAAATLFGYEKEELLGKEIECLMPDRFQNPHVAHREHFVEKPRPRPMGGGFNLYGKHKNGHEIPIDISLGPVKTDNDLLVMALVRDISDRKRMEEKLAESEARWNYALESANQGVWDWHVPEKIIYFSHTWKSMLGYADDEIKNLESEFESRVHPDDLSQVLKSVQDHFDQKTNEYACEVRFRCKDGSYKWILDRGKVVSRAPDGTVLRAIGTHTDISELKTKEAQLKQLAEHDALTGLVNRSLFEDRLKQAILVAERKRDKIAVCFLDLDAFKQVNDEHGHDVGDLLLVASTTCIQSCIRKMDILARLGGDEFALILVDLKNENDVLVIINKIMARFSEGFLIKNIPLNITLSIGIAFYPKDGNDIELIKKADTAMYFVKNNGKNGFHFCS